MKKKHTTEHLRRLIAHWQWIAKEYYWCDDITRIADYIIRKYTRLLKDKK